MAREGFNKTCQSFFDAVKTVLVVAVVCSSAVIAVITMCNSESTESRVEQSRLAIQIHNILVDKTANGSQSLDRDQRRDLIQELLKTYDPQHDSLKVYFDPIERTPSPPQSLTDVIGMVKEQVTGDKKAVIEEAVEAVKPKLGKNWDF